MKYSRGLFFCFLIVIFFICLSCGKRGVFQPVATETSAGNNWDTISFTNGIQTILKTKCMGCHNGDGASEKNFDIYTDLMDASKSYVVPGSSATSKVVTVGGGSHIGGAKLTGVELTKVKYWIDNNNAVE